MKLYRNCSLLLVVSIGVGCGGRPADRPPTARISPPATQRTEPGPAKAAGETPPVAGPVGPVIQLDQRCIADLVRAYENEAAGDAKFTGRWVRFSRRPGGVEKGADGRYVAWYSQIEGESFQHVRCRFRADQGAALAGVGGGPLSLQGRVIGKAGVHKFRGVDYPIVDLDDCQVTP